MEKIYKEVKSIIEALDFSALWQGFHPYDFALCDGKIVQLGDRRFLQDSRFYGNTAIIFEERPLAILHVTEREHPKQLAACLAHEMFHCFQLETGAVFPDDLKLLQAPKTPEYMALRMQEQRCLLCGAQENDAAEKRKWLARFFSLRRQRGAKWKEHVKEETLAESIEGTAEFVELQSLLQLDLEAYQDKLASFCALLGVWQEAQTSVRTMSYCTGAMLLTVARGAELPLCGSMDYAAHLGELLPEVEICPEPPEEKMLAALRALERKLHEKVEALCRHGHRKETKNTRLVGYDPMHMERWKDFVFCAFARLKEESSGVTSEYQGKILLELKPGSDRQVAAVWENP